jgi:membrane protease YdiL (CAAX protease family)
MAETNAVTACALVVVRFLHAHEAVGRQWMTVPSVLLAATLVPAWVSRWEFPRIGLDPGQTRVVAGTVGCMCVCVFRAIFFGLGMLRRLNLPLPSQPVIPERQRWLAPLLYRSFYMTVTERVFFRGYVQPTP